MLKYNFLLRKIRGKVASASAYRANELCELDSWINCCHNELQPKIFIRILQSLRSKKMFIN